MITLSMTFTDPNPDFNVNNIQHNICLQCSDAVGWASGRASDL